LIELEHDGIKSRMTLPELQAFIERLSRPALIRLVVKLAAQIHYLQGIRPKGTPPDSI